MERLYNYFIFGFCFIASFNMYSQSDITEQSRFDEKLFPYQDLYLNKQFPHYTAGLNARKEALRDLSEDRASASRSNGFWISRGPRNIGARINTVAIHPSDPRIVAVGFANGGVWLSTDSCANWTPIFDDQLYPSIASITFDPAEANSIYVATGDKNIGGYYSVGNGLWKSSDLGESWQYLGLEENVILSDVIIHPISHDIYVGAMGPVYERNPDRGLYKSEDGGETWQHSLYIDSLTGIIDIEVHPTDTLVAYATAWTRLRNNKESVVSGDKAGVYKTEDGGKSWTKLLNGLPDGVTSRVNIAMSPFDPDRLAVLVVGADLNAQGLYISDDGGNKWEEVAFVDDTFYGILSGFGWYFGDIAFDPTDDNLVYVMGVDLWKVDLSTGPATIDIAASEWYLYEVHADKHDLQFANGVGYLATDGGLYRKDFIKDSPWEDVEDIPTTEFYRTAVIPYEPDNYIGGAQDNGTTSGNSAQVEWDRVFGGDGFQPAFYRSDPSTWFVETQRGNIRYTIDNGNSFNSATEGLEGSRHWDMQYIISPHDDNTHYTATDKVYKNIGLPTEWFTISDNIVTRAVPSITQQATSIDQSAFDPSVLYVGTSNGLVWGTTDNAVTWDSMQQGLPFGYVSCVKASPNVPSNVYVSFSGYRDGDYTPKLYRSQDYGTTWESISDGLPQVAIDDILIYPYHNDTTIFIGVEGGCYYTLDGGSSWQLLGNNLPIVSITDLAYNKTKNELVAASFGRGIVTFDLSQIGVFPEGVVAVDEVSLTSPLRIYPNPSIDHITFDIPDGQSRDIVIRRMDGSLQFKGRVNNQKIVYTEGWPKGTYLCNDQYHVIKFILQ